MPNYNYVKKDEFSLSKFFFTTIGLVALILVSYAFIKNFILNREVSQEISELESSIANNKKENIELQELIKYFDSQAYAEQKARSELSLRKEGESVVVITKNNEEDKNKILSDKINNEEVAVSNPRKWFNYIFIKK